MGRMTTINERAERLHATADKLAWMEPRHRGTEAGEFLLARINRLREQAYALEEKDV
jgi:hypothetical protein